MRTSQLTLHDVTKRYGDHVVLDQVSLTVKPGEKVGVIGDNGSGKSTLLRLIARQERFESGELTVAAPGGTGYLAQTLHLPPDATVQDAVDLALADLRALESRMRRAEADLATAEEAEPGPAHAAYARCSRSACSALPICACAWGNSLTDSGAGSSWPGW